MGRRKTGGTVRLSHGYGYERGLWFWTKSDAKKYQNELKTKGYLAIVLKSSSQNPDGSTNKGYAVYRRKKRK